MSRYGKGFRPDTVRRANGSIHALLGAHASELPPPPPSATLLEPLLPVIGGVHNQGETSSCVGWTFAECIALRLNYLAANAAPRMPPAPMFSAQFAYLVARAEERKSLWSGETLSRPLVDRGSEPGLCVLGIQEYGLPSESEYPFDPVTINAEPTWSVLEEASAFTLEGYCEIADVGPARSLAVKQALAAGIPVPLATNVDQAFEDYVGAGCITAPTGASLGGHMISVIGYELNPAKLGESQYRLLNHWSTAWGISGLAWVDEAFVQAATNLYALSVTPA